MGFHKINNVFGELIKHKACLCVYSGMQREVIDLHNAFTPVINCSTVGLIIMMVEIDGRESRKIDYFLDFSQAPIDSDVYLNLPAEFHVDGEDKNKTSFLNGTR